MFVLDASMGWMLGGAAAGVVLIALLARQRARRRRLREQIRMPGELSVSVAAPSGPESVQPAQRPATPLVPAAQAPAQLAASPATRPPPLPDVAALAAAPALSAPMPVPAVAPARTAEAIRAEIAAHADRLAAARAARAATSQATRQAAPVAPASPATPAPQTPSLTARPALPPVQAERHPPAARPARAFDPTRSTPWQQVVESVARARSGEAPAAPAAPAAAPHRTAPFKGPLPVLSDRVALPAIAAPGEPAERPCRILVADDARVVRVKLQRLLSAQGWQVIEAADGDTALGLLASQRPDLLITDVDMPGLDGFALTRAVRADAALAALPVIMITGADDQHRDEAGRAGVTMLLGKPYGEAALLAHMRRLMGLRPAAPLAAAAPAVPA